MTRNTSESVCTRCEGRLENPPKGWDEGLKELLWNLREYGYPINQTTVDILLDYLINIDLPPEDLQYDIVAQAISQNYDIEFETKNRVCERHYLESHGIDTENLSEVGVQLALEDFTRAEDA